MREKDFEVLMHATSKLTFSTGRWRCGSGVPQTSCVWKHGLSVVNMQLVFEARVRDKVIRGDCVVGKGGPPSEVQED